jgi:hypothetical protein
MDWIDIFVVELIPTTVYLLSSIRRVVARMYRSRMIANSKQIIYGIFGTTMFVKQEVIQIEFIQGKFNERI